MPEEEDERAERDEVAQTQSDAVLSWEKRIQLG